MIIISKRKFYIYTNFSRPHCNYLFTILKEVAIPQCNLLKKMEEKPLKPQPKLPDFGPRVNVGAGVGMGAFAGFGPGQLPQNITVGDVGDNYVRNFAGTGIRQPVEDEEPQVSGLPLFRPL